MPAATEDKAATDSTRHTLLYVLETLLRLLHPLIPFVTEEIWHNIKTPLGIVGDSISTQPYPELTDVTGDFSQSETDIEWLKAVATQLRSIRSQMNIPPSKHVPLLLQAGNAKDKDRMKRFESALKFLAKCESIEWIVGEAPPSSSAVVGELKLLIPVAGLIDLDAEKTRLDKEIKRIEIEITKCDGKLSSETFVNNAPAAVVEQERTRLVEWNSQLNALKDQRAKI